MPKYRYNPETQQSYIFEGGGWREMSEMEARLAQRPVVSAGLGLVEGATGVIGTMDQEASEAIRSVSPVSAGTGLALSLGAGGVVVGGGRMAARLAARKGAQQATETAARAGRQSLRTEQGFIRPFEQALPESMQGAGMVVRSGAETYPFTRVLTDYLIRNPNQKNLNRLMLRGIGATDDMIRQAGGKVTDDIVAAADDIVSRQFDEVASRLSVDQADVNNLAVRLANDNVISNATLSQVTKNVDDAGRNIMDLRSEVLAATRAERDRGQRIVLQNMMDEIDGVIARALEESGDEVAAKLYSDARARYRLSLALERGQVWTNENINAKSLDTALRNIYGKGYRRSADYSLAPPEVQDLLQGAREATKVNVGVPSSGTAERLAAMSLLSGVTGGAVGSSF